MVWVTFTFISQAARGRVESRYSGGSLRSFLSHRYLVRWSSLLPVAVPKLSNDELTDFIMSAESASCALKSFPPRDYGDTNYHLHCGWLLVLHGNFVDPVVSAVEQCWDGWCAGCRARTEHRLKIISGTRPMARIDATLWCSGGSYSLHSTSRRCEGISVINYTSLFTK